MSRSSDARNAEAKQINPGHICSVDAAISGDKGDWANLRDDNREPRITNKQVPRKNQYQGGKQDTAMENSSDGPLRVPGMGHIPLNEELSISDRFAHGFCEWEQAGLADRDISPKDSGPLAWRDLRCETLDERQGLRLAPAQEDKRTGIGKVQERMDTTVSDAHPEPWYYAFEEEDGSKYSAYFWSYKHQWLPTEIEFSESEALVSACIAPWNDCLIEGRAGWDQDWDYLPESPAISWAPPGNVRPQRGRTPCRIITYGPQWDNEAPEWIAVFDQHRRKTVARYIALKAEIEMIKSQEPPQDADVKFKRQHKLRLAVGKWALAQNKDQDVVAMGHGKEYLERPKPGSDAPVVLPKDWEKLAGIMLGSKTRRLLRLKHPEPGTAFSYEEWKNGTHGGKGHRDMATDRPIRPDKPPAATPHERYTVSL
ncbi:hypothetical protein Micbo1qcDRAFT_178909 [Microdochium bolleyi]|uniref:Uncharacterized protein n=1 Tax=Microdochium bolleyi TaxID=196109 RepID=A0A136IRR2_9PEZI|nr:hypothetical protein Micbo1qcDRAFT_178909 [Microdochium bolleyi]